MSIKKILETIISIPLLVVVFVYKYVISPFTPPSCRHTPTCSNYMIQAIVEWGPLKGSLMGLNRLRKCHPWGTHGYDPVPKNPNKGK